MNEEQMNGQGAPYPPQTPEASQAFDASQTTGQPSDYQAASNQSQNGYMPPQPMYPPQFTQPVYLPAPLMKLSGGMKFGWLVVGALLGIPGILVAWLANVDKMPNVKSDALKFAIIGFVIWIVLGCIFGMMIGGLMAVLIAPELGF